MDEEIIQNISKYISKAFVGLRPVFAFLCSFFCYIVFPDDIHSWALGAVLVASIMDIFTKSYSICQNNGGYRNAVRIKKLFSKNLWKGTEVKIVSYLSIAILTGLSYRVIFLQEAGVILASFVYSVMFMREFQSNIENLIEAGADLGWLLLWSKKKNKRLTENIENEEVVPIAEVETVEETGKADEDYEQRI